MGDILKKTFQIIGFISLVCFSFFYTDKITNVIKENDDILRQINELKDQYKVEPIDATIINDEIIPGMSGSSIDVDKSYDKMKSIDKFNSNLLVYNFVKPNVSVSDFYDKYIISGNLKKQEVSLIFLLQNNEAIEEVYNILNKYDVKGNFFVSINWFENNNESITELIEEEHVIGNYLMEDNNLKSNINWMNAIVSKINNQSKTYCYNSNKNNDFLSICKLNKSYTIKPSIEAFDNPLIQMKASITNGSIVAFKISDKTINELPLIIEYINSRGFDIVTLSELMEE